MQVSKNNTLSNDLPAYSFISNEQKKSILKSLSLNSNYHCETPSYQNNLHKNYQTIISNLGYKPLTAKKFFRQVVNTTANTIETYSDFSKIDIIFGEFSSINAAKKSYTNKEYRTNEFNQSLTLLIDIISILGQYQDIGSTRRKLEACNKLIDLIDHAPHSTEQDNNFIKHIDQNYSALVPFTLDSNTDHWIKYAIRNFLIVTARNLVFPAKTHLQLLDLLIDDQRFEEHHAPFHSSRFALEIEIPIAANCTIDNIHKILNKSKQYIENIKIIQQKKLLSREHIGPMIFLACYLETYNRLDEAKEIYHYIIDKDNKETILATNEYSLEIELSFQLIHSNLGYVNFIQQNYQDAYDNFILAIGNKENPNPILGAVYHLAKMYEEGLGITQDPEQAKKLYICAKNLLMQNSVSAQRVDNIRALRDAKISGVDNDEMQATNGLIQKGYITIEQVYPNRELYNNINNLVEAYRDEAREAYTYMILRDANKMGEGSSNLPRGIV